MFERFLPRLRRAGLSAAEKRQLIVDNPRSVLVPAVTLDPRPPHTVG
jgi:predicted metal-dependent phosphotriesterase family hydrolase